MEKEQVQEEVTNPYGKNLLTDPEARLILQNLKDAREKEKRDKVYKFLYFIAGMIAASFLFALTGCALPLQNKNTETFQGESYPCQLTDAELRDVANKKKVLEIHNDICVLYIQ